MRILLVDDHPDTAESLSLLLRRRGHEVHVAADAKRGLEAASTLAPDAVLLDLGLPDLDGVEVARRLRTGPRGADLFLFAVTGRSTEDRAADALLFDAVMRKPVDIGDVSRALAAAAQRRAAPQ